MADFNPRIVRKRCDKEIKRSRDEGEISIHASYANDATYLPSVAVTGVLISIHASYANDATQLVFLTQSFRVISIHASYANDATDLYVQKIVFRGHFNPRIVRKRCDLIPEECNILRRHFNPRIVRKRCEPGLSGLIASLNFNPRIVRKRCDV